MIIIILKIQNLYNKNLTSIKIWYKNYRIKKKMINNKTKQEKCNKIFKVQKRH